MKFVVQRVSSASVKVSGEITGQINKGYLVLVGIGEGDNKERADKMIDKLCGLRLFEDENAKTNLSIADVNGEFLVVSQFTLYADCRKGNRPSFTDAAKPDLANELYEYIMDKIREKGFHVEHGIFGADMKVELLNDGPFTIILDSEDLERPRRS